MEPIKMSTLNGLRLNLGCGQRHEPGYVNVDLYGEPDVRHDLESFPWPWADGSVAEIRMVHVLEHLGQSPRVYRDIWKELYRICAPDAKVHIVVPHYRHENFASDPTHVRAVTPLGLTLMSQRFNRTWAKAANSPLGLYWEVDFEIVKFTYKPSSDWFRLHPDGKADSNVLLAESAIMNNLIEEITFEMKAIKPPTSKAEGDRVTGAEHSEGTGT
jgi:predicted SAM-dependent methyltransferase